MCFSLLSSWLWNSMDVLNVPRYHKFLGWRFKGLIMSWILFMRFLFFLILSMFTTGRLDFQLLNFQVMLTFQGNCWFNVISQRAHSKWPFFYVVILMRFWCHKNFWFRIYWSNYNLYFVSSLVRENILIFEETSCFFQVLIIISWFERQINNWLWSWS